MRYIHSARNFEGVTLHFSSRAGGFVIGDCVFNTKNGRKVYTAKVHRFKGETPEETLERHYNSMLTWENKTFNLADALYNEQIDRADIHFNLVTLVEARDCGYNVKKANKLANLYEKNRIQFNRINYGMDAVVNVADGGQGRPPKHL